jgi:hypothetical protein
MPGAGARPEAAGVVGAARVLAFADAVQLLEGRKPAGMPALPEAGEALAAQSPELRDILGSAPVRTQAEAFARSDREAGVQQARLMREVTLANVCLLLAGVLSGLVLAGAAIRGQFPELWTERLSLWAGLGTLLLGALAAMLSYQARESDRLRRWLAMRGAAEMARLATFRTIAARAAEAGPAPAMCGLALVSRHLLDEQRRWLLARAARHRRSAEWTNFWGGMATALAFVGGSGAVIASFVQSQAWMPLAGVIGAAVAAYALNREGLRRDRANADRYEKAALALDGFASRVDAVAAEIAAGQPKALPAFVDALAEQLAAEHKQWLDGTAQTDKVIAALDARLRELGAVRAGNGLTDHGPADHPVGPTQDAAVASPPLRPALVVSQPEKERER